MATRKPPLIPVQPGHNVIIVERINIQSKLEKSQKAKAPALQLTKDQISKMNIEKLQSSGDILTVWDEHPMQAVVVAISDDVSDQVGLKVGDKVAFRLDENVGIAIVFKKKRYMSLYPHDILFKYLTSEA